MPCQLSLKNRERNKVFSIVENNSQKTMGTRWVLTMKKLDSGEIVPKARLALKGCQEEMDKIERGSPVIARRHLGFSLFALLKTGILVL